MIQRPTFWLRVSVATIVVSALIIAGVRPTFGIDFTGGSLIEIAVRERAGATVIRDALEGSPGEGATIQESEAGRWLVKTVALSEEAHQDVLEALRQKDVLEEELRFESIGPTIGAELRRKAWIAVAIVVLVLIAYLAYTFREAAGLISSWKFGIAAVYALVHDLLLVTALFALLGKTYGVTIDTMFVTAMLALLGYSVNDTIVIFNRLKADWRGRQSGSLLDTLDSAVSRSLVRSLNTSLTTLLVLTSLLLIGGTTIRWFIVALAAGTIVGTYSSIFVAPPLLYYLAKR